MSDIEVSYIEILKIIRGIREPLPLEEFVRRVAQHYHLPPTDVVDRVKSVVNIATQHGFLHKHDDLYSTRTAPKYYVVKQTESLEADDEGPSCSRQYSATKGSLQSSRGSQVSTGPGNAKASATSRGAQPDEGPQPDERSLNGPPSQPEKSPSPSNGPQGGSQPGTGSQSHGSQPDEGRTSKGGPHPDEGPQPSVVPQYNLRSYASQMKPSPQAACSNSRSTHPDEVPQPHQRSYVSQKNAAPQAACSRNPSTKRAPSKSNPPRVNATRPLIRSISDYQVAGKPTRRQIPSRSGVTKRVNPIKSKASSGLKKRPYKSAPATWRRAALIAKAKRSDRIRSIIRIAGFDRRVRPVRLAESLLLGEFCQETENQPGPSPPNDAPAMEGVEEEVEDDQIMVEDDQVVLYSGCGHKAFVEDLDLYEDDLMLLSKLNKPYIHPDPCPRCQMHNCLADEMRKQRQLQKRRQKMTQWRRRR